MKALLRLTTAAVALSAGSAALAATGGAECKAALDAPVEFRISHQNTTTSPIHPQLEAIVAEVEAATEGRLKLTIFPNAQLGGPVQALEQAALGENVIFYITSGNLATVGVPEFSILNGPFLTDTLADAQKLESSGLVRGWEDALAEKGRIRVLALNWFDAPRSILGHRAYPAPADLDGAKMRVPEAPAYMRTFEALNTAPMAIPFSELYLALQQGVVQAAEGGIDGMAQANLMEVAKFVTVTDHFRLFYGFAMSEDLHAELPAPCQTFLGEAFTEKGAVYSAGMDAITEATIARLKGEGVTFVEADKAAYKAATESFYGMFPEWPAGLLDQVRAAMQ